MSRGDTYHRKKRLPKVGENVDPPALVSSFLRPSPGLLIILPAELSYMKASS